MAEPQPRRAWGWFSTGTFRAAVPPPVPPRGSLSRSLPELLLSFPIALFFFPSFPPLFYLFFSFLNSFLFSFYFFFSYFILCFLLLHCGHRDTLRAVNARFREQINTSPASCVALFRGK